MITSIINAITNGNYRKITAPEKSILKVNVDTIWTELSKMDIPTELVPIVKFDVENTIRCLPLKYKIGYILTSLFNIFNDSSNIDLLYDPRSRVDADTKHIIDKMIDSMDNNRDVMYYYRIVLSPSCKVDLPWNDYILSNISYVKSNQRMAVSNTLDYDLIYNKVMNILTSDREYMTHLFNEHRFRSHFINETKPASICINGTACAGKSSLINSLLTTIKMNYDENSFIIKSGRLGAWRGKDDNQILAMSYQLTALNEVHDHPTAIMDRCPFNNLIWRYIMRFINPSDDIESLCKDISTYVINTLSSNTVKTMQRYPIVVLIDTHIEENRERMYFRGIGGDRYRCYIENYVPMQNLFYALFADLANWPVYNTTITSSSYPTDQNAKIKSLKQMILTKIERNIEERGKIKLPIKLSYCEKFSSTQKEDFDGAKRMKICK
uniref:Uncharacterized protein n=1 Tax=Penaeus monodon nucleopolyhedrovirus TaxID=259389 RepID=A9LMF7_9BACU|nr:hypothetical protein [Penaeus monodon nucleopolyhedrovirus]